jgi:hypothetical protein
MSKRETRVSTRPPKLTRERVEALLRQSAKDANELLKQIEPCFRLSEKSSNLRLNG